MIQDTKVWLAQCTKLNTATGCLEWQKACNKWGYGIAKIKAVPESLVHRIAWVIFNGEIPLGKYILHRCNNTRCCNVKHLYVGTQLDNMQDVTLQGTKRYISGCTHHNAVLTPEDVQQIRQMLKTTSQNAVATYFGVSNQCIKRIKSGVTWKHV